MDIAPPPLPRSSRLRWWHGLIAGLGVFVAFSLAFALWSRDEPAPDIRDFTRKPPSLPDADNAFAILVSAAQSVDASPWEAEGERYTDVARGKAWNADRAGVWLAANAHVWPAIERAAALPSSQGPVITSLDEIGVPSVGPLRQLAELSRLRALQLFHTGRREEAFQWLATCLHASRRLSDANSTLIVWLAGISGHTAASQTIETLVARASFPPESGRALIQALEATRPSAEALAATIRHEYVMLPLLVERIADDGESPSSGIADFDALLAAARRFPVLFKPHRTERLHAENLREVIGQIDAEWAVLQRASENQTDHLLGAGWRRWNPDNAAGRVILSAITPTLHAILGKRLRAQSAISATQSLIALRLYEMERGTLPERLSDLVPQYLPKVPLDYFDRQPLRYSREFRAVWSVGKKQLSITDAAPTVDSEEVYLKVPTSAR